MTGRPEPVSPRLEPLATSLLRQPVAYLSAEHDRLRKLCAICDSLAANPGLEYEAVTVVCRYAVNDFDLHLTDEDHDLFPLLRRRARPEDEIDVLLGHLLAEHAVDLELARTIASDLQDHLDENRLQLSAEAGLSLTTFARRQRRHLALENATVIPLARARLSDNDLDALAHRMAARRGILLDVNPNTRA